MNVVIISADEPPELAAIGFPVVCLYLLPRRPELTDEEQFAIWQKIRDLVNAHCGGEAAFVGHDGGLLFYPNHQTPLLKALLTAPGFYSVLEEHDLDGRALKLYFHHNQPWSGRPDAFALQAEERILPAFNVALRQMRRFSATLHPIAPDVPDGRALCHPMPPMTWFLKPLPGAPAKHTGVSAFQNTGTDL